MWMGESVLCVRWSVGEGVQALRGVGVLVM